MAETTNQNVPQAEAHWENSYQQNALNQISSTTIPNAPQFKLPGVRHCCACHAEEMKLEREWRKAGEEFERERLEIEAVEQAVRTSMDVLLDGNKYDGRTRELAAQVLKDYLGGGR